MIFRLYLVTHKKLVILWEYENIYKITFQTRITLFSIHSCWWKRKRKRRANARYRFSALPRINWKATYFQSLRQMEKNFNTVSAKVSTILVVHSSPEICTSFRCRDQAAKKIVYDAKPNTGDVKKRFVRLLLRRKQTDIPLISFKTSENNPVHSPPLIFRPWFFLFSRYFSSFFFFLSKSAKKDSVDPVPNFKASSWCFALTLTLT